MWNVYNDGLSSTEVKWKTVLDREESLDQGGAERTQGKISEIHVIFFTKAFNTKAFFFLLGKVTRIKVLSDLANDQTLLTEDSIRTVTAAGMPGRNRSNALC